MREKLWSEKTQEEIVRDAQRVIGQLPLHMGPIKTLAEVEREHTLTVLDQLGENKAAAARALGISLKSLFNKLHEWDVFERYKCYTKGSK